MPVWLYRLIMEGRGKGATAINYVKVTDLLREGEQVVGIKCQPEEVEQPIELKAKMVISATGAWADKLNSDVILRPLRGSHILVPSWRLPIANVVTLLHPRDKRPVMIYPWQNATLVGTTDLDHEASMNFEPKMTREELDYIFEAIDDAFPTAKINDEDLLSSYAGVRPIVLDKPLDKKRSASSEKREHSLFKQPGFITVTGGKLTTFRVIANHVMREAASELGLDGDIPDFVLFDNPEQPIDDEHSEYLGGSLRTLQGRFCGFCE